MTLSELLSKAEYYSLITDEEYKELKKQIQPCEDCISRAKALEMLGDVPENWTDTEKEIQEVNDYRWFKSILEELPSVTPQPKMGRWIMKHRIHNEVKHYTGQDEMGETHTISVLERYEVDEPYCSECGKRAGDTAQDYCCACGAKMEVEE